MGETPTLLLYVRLVKTLPPLPYQRFKVVLYFERVVVEDAARFEEIVRKSYQNNRQLKLKQQKKKTYLLADNGSKTFKAYDKRQELAEKHTRSPNLPEMLQEADGVIRIELSIKKPDRDTLKSLFGLTIPVAPKNAPAYLKCGLIPFFYETSDWGDRLMLKLWQQHIGTEPWLNRHYINKAIDNSRAWPETKKLAKEVTFVISRKRSLSEAREAYVQGVDIHGRHYKGSAEDFDKAVRFLRKIGVQPFRIPSPAPILTSFLTVMSVTRLRQLSLTSSSTV